MNRRRLAIAIVTLAVLGPLGGLIWFESNLDARRSQRPEVGMVFPALPGLAEGESLPASPGRLRVVTFAKAGCGNCDRTIAALRRLAASGESDFDLIAVVSDAPTTGLKDTAGLYSIADPDASLAKRFGVIHVPLVFLVDEHSRVRDVTTGERPEAAWRSFLGFEGDAL
ncbi:MAG: redoxin family protein [Acidobacteria bacterium]|nr:redoxin family protein [Acidobacteriota bacterium]